MMDRKRTIFILLAVLVLAAGVAMAGNTFASRVDKTSETETPYTGSNSYNVDIAYYTGNNDADTPQYQSLKETGSTFSKEMIWCPGRTEIAYIKITNRELFPVECAPILVTAVPQGQTVDLGEVLNFAVKKDWATPADMKAANWQDFLNKAEGSGKLAEGRHIALNPDGEKLAMYALDPGASACFALAIHMDETASDIYQEASLGLQVVLDVDANYKPGADPDNTSEKDTSR